MSTAKYFIGAYLLFCSFVLIYIVSPVFADPLRSSNYQFQETSLGGSGLLSSQSNNYQLSSTSGVLGVGNEASAAFQANAGHMTTPDPSLAFSVNTSTATFPVFSPSQASTTVSSFSVINYTSYGYVVQALGTAPTHGAHTITAMSSTAPSQAGQEQFGINLVANTSPVSLGANPDNGQFGYGTAATNYDTADNYRFVSGETIASAPKTSGMTTYTISYIVNVSSLTPAGDYTGTQTILCTGTY